MSIRANVDARALDTRVTFERDYGTRDASGDTPQLWRPFVQDVPAKVDGAKGSEFSASGGIVAQGVYTVWIRADIVSRFSVTAKDRIVWKGRILNIGDMPDQGLRGRLTALACTAGVNAG